MIHWPSWTIAGTLCGFDRDPMRERATCVAQIIERYDGGVQWSIGVPFMEGEMWEWEESMPEAKAAAEAAIGGEA